MAVSLAFRMQALALVGVSALAASTAAAPLPTGAEPAGIVLRLGTPAPEGSAWSRSLRNFARDVEAGSRGRLRVKVYYGGIAGDELQMIERIRREQLDGAFSGGMMCVRLAPTLRVMRVLGLFQSRDELGYVLGRLRPAIDDELRRAGYVDLGVAGFGSELVFTRRPVHALDELRAQRLWTWSEDETLLRALDALGVPVVAADLDNAARLYDQGKVDGFVATPMAALAFQWSAQARYVLPLRLAALNACVVMADRAFDRLSAADQRLVRDAVAKQLAYNEDIGRRQDDALVRGRVGGQGLVTLPVSDALRAEFFDATRRVRERLGERLVPRPLLDRVLALLADYRAEHRVGEAF